MKLFSRVFAGNLKSGVSLEEVRRQVAESFRPNKVTTYSLQQLATGEILFLAASEANFDVKDSKTLRCILSDLLDYICDEIDVFDEPDERYLMCFDTPIRLHGRSDDEDRLHSVIYGIAGSNGLNIDFYFSGSYFILLVQQTDLEANLRQQFRQAVEEIFPNSFIFDHPVLPKE